MASLPEQQNLSSFIHQAFDIFQHSEGEIKPHFVITGPSGTGKSYLVSQVAQNKKLNIININAAQITAEGVSGNSLSKALSGLADAEGALTVVFVDEFDKWFMPDTKGTINSSTVTIQNEFLKLLESDSTEVFGNYGKYVKVSLDRVMFVFAGAFNGLNITNSKQLLEAGIKKEFVGRVPIVKATSEISLESMLDMLKNSKLLEDYCKILNINKSKAFKEISKMVTEDYKQNVLGVRLVVSKIHTYFLD